MSFTVNNPGVVAELKALRAELTTLRGVMVPILDRIAVALEKIAGELKPEPTPPDPDHAKVIIGQPKGP